MRKVIEFNNESEMFKARCVLSLNMANGKDFMMYNVLYEISRHNVGGVVEGAMRVNREIVEKLGISQQTFDVVTHRLRKLGIITRKGACYIVHPLLAHSTDMAKDELLLRFKD